MLNQSGYGGAVGDVRLLGALHGGGYAYVQLEEDVKQIAIDHGQSPEHASGAVVKAGNGFLEEVWITTESRPFESGAGYERVA